MRFTKEWTQRVDKELARWPGVKARRERGAKHYRLVLRVGGKERFVTYPGSPSGSPCAILNHIQNIRGQLREMGAVRSSPKKPT